MKKLILNFLVVSLVFLFACNEEESKLQISFAPKVIEAKGYLVPKDSVSEPITVPAGIPITIKAGQPKVNPTNLNVHIAGQPKIIVAGLPKINTPGTDTFLLPKTIPALGKTKPAGIPEVVIAKDAAAKDVNPANFSFYKTLQGLKHNTVRRMLQDKTGNLWFGTNGGVCRYDGKSFTNFTEKEGLSNNFVWSILEDKTGNLWFGTDGGGVSRYDGKSFTNFTEKEGLSNNVVGSILEDKTGNLWFGTNGGGVCRYDGKSFTNFTEKEGLSNNVVWSILEDKTGNLWFGTISGVCRYDGNCVDDIIHGTNLYQHTEQDLKKNKKDLVKSFTNFTEKEGLSNNVVNAILEDKTGNLWFGTNGGGVCRYDGKSFTNFTEKEGLSNNVVNAILEDKTGNLWFGTRGGGVSRYDGNCVDDIIHGTNLYQHTEQDLKKNKKDLVKSFTNFTEKEGLSNNFVWSILEDKTGNLWFGTNSGVCRYDGNCVDDIIHGTNLYQHTEQDLKKNKKDLVKSFTNFTEKEGLSNNAVLNMMQDVEGNIWFGTRKGLSKVERAQLIKLAEINESYNPIKEALFYNYGYNDGFLGLNCRRNSVLQDSKGRIWWGTDVLTCYDPKGNIADTTAPLVNLTSIKLFGEEIEWANLNAVYTDSTGKEIIKGKTNDTLLSNGILLKDIKFDGLTKWYNLPEHLSLPYNNNNLTFNFIGLHMQSRNHIKYQYKLEGMDPDWSSITDRTEAPYGNLPSGDYIFKIKAMNQSGVWSVPFEFHFVVRPPWWQTWWFRTLVGVLIIASIWYYIKSREKKLVAEKEKLERTVEERTAEVVEEKKIVEQKNVLVEAQKHVIEEKHKEITDSINYAERIQRSFIATKEILDENLNDYFVLFKPKDVVSGDFYWASKLNNGNFALATADSTGHGVPGAIMSLLNITSLEKAIETLNNPSDILNATRKTIIERLKKDGSPEGGKDGMDASLCVYDFKNKKLTIAAANNPVWIMRGTEVIEIKPDKMPIGKHDRDSVSFTQQDIDLQTGDVIYALTDGFPDQFGGEKGKKFTSKNLRELLAANSHLPIQEQKQLFEKTFANWVGDLEQVDDVTIIGVRV
jgi:ligand-binding sensor domain-containing protein/serine phosphatase RsbU (regulator of sigma subunit)